MRRAIGVGLAGWGLIAVWLVAFRLIQGDRAEAYDLVLTGAVLAAAVLAPGAAIWAVVHPRPLFAALLAVVWTVVAVFGGAELFAALFPQSNEAAGPAAMAWLLPLLTGFGTLMPALALRGLIALFRR